MRNIRSSHFRHELIKQRRTTVGKDTVHKPIDMVLQDGGVLALGCLRHLVCHSALTMTPVSAGQYAAATIGCPGGILYDV